MMDDVDGVWGRIPPLQALVNFKGPMQERFEAFHALNPDVCRLITQIALDLQRRGFRRCGISLIFERMRWLYAIQTEGEDYKLNNNYRAFYARLVMHREPRLEKFFELRKQWVHYDPKTTDEASA